MAKSNLTEADFDREIVFTPAWDRRDPDPSKNYGIGSVEVRFYLRGPKGIVQFAFCTGWLLDDVERGMMNDGRAQINKPYAFDLGYHAIEPQHEEHEPMECDLMPSGECYYDGSGLAANETFSRFKEKGSKWLWEKLLETYWSWLVGEGLEAPSLDVTRIKWGVMRSENKKEADCEEEKEEAPIPVDQKGS